MENRRIVKTLDGSIAALNTWVSSVDQDNKSAWTLSESKNLQHVTFLKKLALSDLGQDAFAANMQLALVYLTQFIAKFRAILTPDTIEEEKQDCLEEINDEYQECEKNQDQYLSYLIKASELHFQHGAKWEVKEENIKLKKLIQLARVVRRWNDTRHQNALGLETSQSEIDLIDELGRCLSDAHGRQLDDQHYVQPIVEKWLYIFSFSPSRFSAQLARSYLRGAGHKHGILDVQLETERVSSYRSALRSLLSLGRINESSDLQAKLDRFDRYIEEDHSKKGHRIPNIIAGFHRLHLATNNPAKRSEIIKQILSCYTDIDFTIKSKTSLREQRQFFVYLLALLQRNDVAPNDKIKIITKIYSLYEEIAKHHKRNGKYQDRELLSTVLDVVAKTGVFNAIPNAKELAIRHLVHWYHDAAIDSSLKDLFLTHVNQVLGVNHEVPERASYHEQVVYTLAYLKTRPIDVEKFAQLYSHTLDKARGQRKLTENLIGHIESIRNLIYDIKGDGEDRHIGPLKSDLLDIVAYSNVKDNLDRNPMAALSKQGCLPAMYAVAKQYVEDEKSVEAERLGIVASTRVLLTLINRDTQSLKKAKLLEEGAQAKLMSYLAEKATNKESTYKKLAEVCLQLVISHTTSLAKPGEDGKLAQCDADGVLSSALIKDPRYADQQSNLQSGLSDVLKGRVISTANTFSLFKRGSQAKLGVPTESASAVKKEVAAAKVSTRTVFRSAKPILPPSDFELANLEATGLNNR